MKIAAEIRFKQGDVFEALKKLGWTYKDLAERTGLHPGSICSYITLKRKPYPKIAVAICDAFSLEGIYLNPTECWPDSFKGFGKNNPVIQYISAPPESLIGNKEALMVEAPNSGKEMMDYELKDAIHTALDTLTDREQLVVKMRFGLDGYDEHSLREIGDSLGIQGERVRQLEAKALRKLRHPTRRQYIEEFVV